MTKQEKAIREFCGHHADWWPSTTQVQEMLALAQPEQEPVAWMFQHDETGRMNYVSNDGIHDPTMFLGINPRYALVCPLYTTPPQRTWVGLTDEERQDIALEVPIDAVLITEAILKDKNTQKTTGENNLS